jgi:hypothetical protein
VFDLARSIALPRPDQRVTRASSTVPKPACMCRSASQVRYVVCRTADPEQTVFPSCSTMAGPARRELRGCQYPFKSSVRKEPTWAVLVETRRRAQGARDANAWNFT